MKGQTVRVLDVVLVGPAMVAGGSLVYAQALDGQRRALGGFLIFAGIATVLYNGNNWFKGEAAREAAAAAASTPASTPPAAAPPTGAPLAPRT